MKKSAGYLKYTAVLALIVTFIALSIWIKGMYHSSTINYLQTADKCLKQASDTELNIRRTSGKVKYKSWFDLYAKDDTSAYVNKTIELEDTIIHIRIRKDDPTALTKLRQFQFQFSLQLNPTDVDSVFRVRMAENSLPIKASYVEYLDLKKDTLIASNAPEGKLSGYLASNVDTLDIMKSLGVRANTKVPLLLLLRPVMMEVVIAVALMLIVVACIIKLIVDIRKLHAKGFRLLHFMSLKTEHSLHKAAGKVKEVAGQLQDKELNEEAAKMLQTYDALNNEADHSGRLWRYLANEEGKVEFNKAPVDIMQVFYELEDTFEAMGHKKISVITRCPEGLIFVTDEIYFTRIIYELMDNAVKFSDDKVQIFLSAERDGDRVIITVRDNGWGIPQKHIDDVFDFPYTIPEHAERLKEAGQEEGFGLGLSFVQSFVAALGGKINISSILDQFTMFRIAFPISPDDEILIARYKGMFGKE